MEEEQIQCCESEKESEYSFELPPILICENNLEDIQFNKEQFQKGLDDISYVCGMFTGMVNAGMLPVDAMSYLLNIQTIENNLEMARINSKTSVEVAKEQAVQVEKNSI